MCFLKSSNAALMCCVRLRSFLLVAVLGFAFRLRHPPPTSGPSGLFAGEPLSISSKSVFSALWSSMFCMSLTFEPQSNTEDSEKRWRLLGQNCQFVICTLYERSSWWATLRWLLWKLPRVGAIVFKVHCQWEIHPRIHLTSVQLRSRACLWVVGHLSSISVLLSALTLLTYARLFIFTVFINSLRIWRHNLKYGPAYTVVVAAYNQARGVIFLSMILTAFS